MSCFSKGQGAPVFANVKDSGQTMAFSYIDHRHLTNAMRMNSRVLATQKSELSADGKSFMTETMPASPGVPKTTEIRDNK